MDCNLPFAASDWRPAAPIPADKPLNTLKLLRTIYTNPLEAWTQAHFERPFVITRLFGTKAIAVNEPTAIRHPPYPSGQLRQLSQGLAAAARSFEWPQGRNARAEDEQWQAQRRSLAPIFARKTVMGFAAAMQATAEDMIGQWRDGHTIDIAAEVTRMTLDVLRRTIFSTGLGRDPEEFRIAMAEFFNAIGRIDALDIIGAPDFMPRFGRWKARRALRFFDAAIDEIISDRRRLLAEDLASAPKDILTLLLKAQDPETGKGMTEAEVRANVITFISAGHETTANMLTWSLYLLSQSPQWRERIAAEAQRERFGPAETLADRLIETRAVIEEAARLYPPIAAISRAAIGADEFCGININPGDIVVIAPYLLHRHRALWDRPHIFDPHRFLNGAREKIDRYAYLPFGAGPRICIGAAFALQEATLALAAIVRHVILELAPGHRVWPILRVTLKPQDGLPMIVRREAANSGSATTAKGSRSRAELLDH
ncbi:MAG: cytochrome P450 [Rhodomicrobium sp.]